MCSLSADETSRIYSKGNSLKFWPKVIYPVDLSVADIRYQIVAKR